MATLKKQRRIDKDNRIKDTAIVLFAEHGYEGAQLSYISKLAGIRKQGENVENSYM